MSTTAPSSVSRTLVASIAGGPARQFRVQVLPSGELSWRLFASYKSRELATEAARQLTAEGIDARVVDVRIGPTAA